MIEYVSLTLLAEPGETEAAFKSRLTGLWSAMVKASPVDYEKVYSEAAEFERAGDRVSREYRIDPDVWGVLGPLLKERGVAFTEIDFDELYSKAEASANDWFQIEH